MRFICLLKWIRTKAGSCKMKTKQFILFLFYLTAATVISGQNECHCLNKADCPNCNSQCDPDWSGPSCHKYNIARNRSAYQNSDGLICSTSCRPQPASLAVDGDTRRDKITRCSRTGEIKDTASLTVLFDHPKLIDRIGLYFPNERTDRGDFQVWVDGKSCYNRSLTDPVTPHIEIACVQQMVGKMVTVLLPPFTNTYRVLALCEIEIYECEKQWSGENCDIFCSNCTGDKAVCDQRNQDCYNRDVNIAYGETVFFIRAPAAQYGLADWAINGNTADANCAAVMTSAPWWEIQFGKTRIISRIKIFWSSTDVPSSYTITVDDILCYHQVSSPSPSPSLAHTRVFSFSCPLPLRGDYVRIQRLSTEKEELMICEVEIFECTDQFFGPDCKHRCNCQGSEYCDKVNGTCFSLIAATVATTPVTTQTSSSQSTSSLSTRTTSSSTTTTPPSNEPTEESLTSITKPAWSSTSTTEKQETSDVKINQSGGVKVFDLIESRFPASIQGDPSVTTDGNTSLASCVIINGTQPSWKVTFDKQYIIDGLKLYIPLSAELTKFSVQIEGTFCYQRSSSVPIVTPYRFQCFDKRIGDSVTIFVPQAESMVSLSLCEVEIYGESAKTTDSYQSTDSNLSDAIPIPAIVVPCVIAVIIGVVVVIIVVLRHRGYSCVKSKETTNEPHYAGLDRKPEDYYTTLTPPTYQNEPGSNTYENEQIQLEGRNT